MEITTVTEGIVRRKNLLCNIYFVNCNRKRTQKVMIFELTAMTCTFAEQVKNLLWIQCESRGKKVHRGSKFNDILGCYFCFLYSNFIRMFFLSPYIEIQFQNSSDNGFACNGGFCSQCASNDEGGRHASVCDDYGATV